MLTAQYLNSGVKSITATATVAAVNGASNVMDIAITGTYQWTPIGGIEASFNGGPWTNITSNPSGGTYSGTLSAQPIVSGSLLVRFANDHTVSVTKTVTASPVDVVCLGSGLMSIGQGLTKYHDMGDTGFSAGGSATEPQAQRIVRTPGTVKSVYVVIQSNTLSGSCVVKSRVNGAYGGQSATITTGTVGEVPITGSDALVNGDLFCWEIAAAAGSGTIKFTLWGHLVTPADGTATKWMANGNGDFFNANQKSYVPIGGIQSPENTVEGNAQVKFRIDGTMKNMAWYDNANTRSDQTTFGTRINVSGSTVDGTLVVNPAASFNGLLEDTTRSDAVAVGDLVCMYGTTGAGTGHIGWTLWGVDFVPRSEQSWLFVCMRSGTTSPCVLTAGETAYCALGGAPCDSNGNRFGTEADVQYTVRSPFVISRAAVNTAANNATANSTFTLRVNGVDTALTITVGPGVNAITEDSNMAHAVTVGAGQKVCWKMTAGTGGTVQVNGLTSVGTGVPSIA